MWSAVARRDDRHRHQIGGVHLDAADTKSHPPGSPPGKWRVKPDPSIPAAPPVGCNFVPPDATAVKASTPRCDYAPRVPALTAFAPVGVNGSPTGGSAGEGGIKTSLYANQSNTKDYLRRALVICVMPSRNRFLITSRSAASLSIPQMVATLRPPSEACSLYKR